MADKCFGIGNSVSKSHGSKIVPISVGTEAMQKKKRQFQHD